MAELLVRIKDKVNNEDLYKDVQLTKRGDVIVIQEDGWGWSAAELKNPEWQIIKVPGVPVRLLEHLLAPEVDTNPDPLQRSKTLQRRMVKLNLDNVPSKTSFTYAVTAERTTPYVTFNTESVDINNYIVTKTAIIDPAIIDNEIDPLI